MPGYEPVINLGGTTSCGRLYLKDLEFFMPYGVKICVKKTFKKDIDMADLIARHRGRYGLVSLFCRPGYKILDFPCGSGYAADLLKDSGVIYEGRDIDLPTLHYATSIYGRKGVSFLAGDLCNPQLTALTYDTIACIEGLEHISRTFQSPLISAFKGALNPGGTLIVSSPEPYTGISGRSKKNPWHEWELNRQDFLALLYENFKKENVELVTHEAILHTGELTTCLYGICHKY